MVLWSAALALSSGCGLSSQPSKPAKPAQLKHFGMRGQDLISLAGDIEVAVYGVGTMSPPGIASEFKQLAGLARMESRALDRQIAPPELARPYAELKLAVSRAERDLRAIARKALAGDPAAARRARRRLLRDSRRIFERIGGVSDQFFTRPAKKARPTS
jgi:hypothetical protein